MNARLLQNPRPATAAEACRPPVDGKTPNSSNGGSRLSAAGRAQAGASATAEVLQEPDAVEQSMALIQEYRDRCLWFLKPDYVPQTTIEILRVLDLIERYGDRSGYCRAREIKQWLLPDSRVKS